MEDSHETVDGSAYKTRCYLRNQERKITWLGRVERILSARTVKKVF